MKFLKRNIAALIVAGLVLGVGGAAYAAQPQRPSLRDQPGTAPASADGAGGAGARRPGGLLRRAVHAELTVRGKDGFKNVTIDRGKLASVDGDTLKIDRPDGASVTVTLTDSTRYRRLAGKDALEVGKPTIVVSKDGNALVVGQPKARTAAAASDAGSGTVQ